MFVRKNKMASRENEDKTNCGPGDSYSCIHKREFNYCFDITNRVETKYLRQQVGKCSVICGIKYAGLLIVQEVRRCNSVIIACVTFD